MAQRIFNLSKWCWIGEGMAMPFPNTRRRNVTLEVNTPTGCSFYVIQRKEDLMTNPEKVNDYEAGRPSRTVLPDPVLGFQSSRQEEDLPDNSIFLCYVARGRDTIEFGVDGAFELFAVDGDAYVFSQDSQYHAVHIEDPLVFTRIANRRQRNPQMEMMMWQQRQNMDRRFATLAADAERRIVAAEQGARERYVRERDIRAPEGRRLPGGAAEGEGSPEAGGGEDVRAAGSDSREGAPGSRMAGEKGVSSPAAQSRTKVKSSS